jgi:RNA polymerase sigma-70 factor (ECF subfamily)
MRARRPADDHPLVLAAKEGDPTAWRALYEAVGGRVLGWLRTQSLLDSAQDADDLASETWLVAARKIADFSGDLDDFTGWIFVIARNLTVNSNRRARRRGTVPTDVDRLLGVDAAADDDFAAADAMDWVAHALRQLTPRERDVVAALDVADLDVATTSRLLGMSRTAVRVAHHRAIRRLAAILATDEPARAGDLLRRGRSDLAEPATGDA